ncbi:MAG: cytochrome b/b6 domain-containing protein, partial [Tumebacillaceae bacterium]
MSGERITNEAMERQIGASQQRVDQQHTGQVHTTWLNRFNKQERALHSVVMLLFLVLLATGLCLHFDTLRELFGAWRYEIRTIHHYTGLLLMILPWYLVWSWRRELAAFFNEMTHWRRVEAAYILRETKKAYKFNGGQKLNFLLAMTWMLGLAVTGFFVWQSQLISSDTREFLYSWHKFLFYLLTIQIAGHVFYAAIYKPTRHALQGMLHGKVERDWAKTHHPLWVEDVEKED